MRTILVVGGSYAGFYAAWRYSRLARYWSPARTDVMRWVLKPSQCIRPT